MSNVRPLVSVVIPTHNRRPALERLLDSLARQTCGCQTFEVIVVADGCTDDTVDAVQALALPYRIRIQPQSQAGPAHARNTGARLAHGEFLLFLDDDVEAAPGLVAAHRRAQETVGGAVVGPYPPAGAEKGLLQIDIRSWWYNLFDKMLDPGHRFSYRDLLTGNVSLRRATFEEVGGFQVDLIVHEDYELGMRLIKAGVPISATPGALGWHYETISLARTLGRKRQEGVADVKTARKHPDMALSLPLAQPCSSRAGRGLKAVAFEMPAAFGLISGRLIASLRRLEAMRLRRRWRATWAVAQEYYYWLGVASELGSRAELKVLLKEARARAVPEAAMDIDLAEGIRRAAERLDRERPGAARLYFGERLIGAIPAEPGSEPLRGVHLRPLLATRMAQPLLEALALDGRISAQLDGVELAGKIRSRMRWWGAPGPEDMWMEQYSQWGEHEWTMDWLKQLKAQATGRSAGRWQGRGHTGE